MIRETQLVIMGAAGRIDLAHVYGFESHQTTKPVRAIRADGAQIGAELPVGWAGAFDISHGGAADDLIGAIEEGSYTDASQTTMYQYLMELDGSVTTYQFDGVVLALGAKQPEGRYHIQFNAERKRRI